MFSGSSEEFNQVVDSINVLQNLTLKKEAKLEVLVCGPSIERKKFENLIFSVRIKLIYPII